MTEENHLRRGTSGEDRLAEILLREMREFRQEVGKRLDSLVTRDAFEAEKERVNERMGDIREDVSAESRARERAVNDEREARIAAVAIVEEKRLLLERETEKRKSRDRWLVGVALAPLAFMLMQYALNILAAGR